MGRFFRALAVPAFLLVLSTSSVFGQSVISARSGLIHYVEGQVTLDDKAVEVKYSQFPEVKDNQVLKTEEGRAEVLLTPGVVLRLSENSSFRMISSRLADTRVQALGGSVMIEHGEVAKENLVTLVYKDRTISFLKSGLYRLDAENGVLRVYQGEAKVVAPDQNIVAKQSHEIPLEAAVLTSMKFDAKSDDDFYRWASRRAGYLAMANVSAAKSLHDSGSYSSAMSSGLWSYNPWYGMFTYIPMGGGMWNSPFGYSYYSPYLISRFYNYYPGYYGYYGNNGNYGGGGNSGGGRTSTNRGRFESANSYSVPSRPAASASPSFANRGGFEGRSIGGGMSASDRGGYSSGGGASAVSSGGGASASGSSSRGGSGGGGGAAPSGGASPAGGRGR
jgi:hypothetical protein